MRKTSTLIDTLREKQVVEESVKVGSRNYALCISTCSVGVDWCWVEVNLATLTSWGYYQILDIGLSPFDTQTNLPSSKYPC